MADGAAVAQNTLWTSGDSTRLRCVAPPDERVTGEDERGGAGRGVGSTSVVRGNATIWSDQMVAT